MKKKTTKKPSKKKIAELCAQCGKPNGKNKVIKKDLIFCCQKCCDTYEDQQKNKNVCQFC